MISTNGAANESTTPEQVEATVKLMREAWKKKEITWKEIPFHLREKVTGISPTQKIVK